jgi:hypothetical protein
MMWCPTRVSIVQKMKSQQKYTLGDQMQMVN